MTAHLSTTYLCQRDDAWASIPLGMDNRYTIGSAGCLITAVCEMFRYMGAKVIYPDEINRWLCNNKGYVGGHRFVFNSLDRIPGLGMKLVEYIDCSSTPAPMDKIIDAIMYPSETGNNDRGILLKVRFDPSKSSSQHWLLGLMTTRTIDDESDIFCADPWTGYAVNLLRSRYSKYSWSIARTIFGAAIYEVG